MRFRNAGAGGVLASSNGDEYAIAPSRIRRPADDDAISASYTFGKVHFDYTADELAGLAPPSTTGEAYKGD